jgi:hypothetical protein
VDINNASAMAQTQGTQAIEIQLAAKLMAIKKRRTRRRSIQVCCSICVNSKA